MASGSHIHYGSLEKAELERLAKLEEETKKRLEMLRSNAPPASTATAETVELSSSSLQTVARHQELKDSITKRRRARELAVPTNDNQVKLKLREAGEPICLFGEGAPERRERLRDVMAAQIDLDEPALELRGAQTLDQLQPKVAKVSHDDAAAAPEEDRQKEVFYTEGSQELREARMWILADSARRAAARLAAERERVLAHCADVTAIETQSAAMTAELRRVENQMSNFGDERPVSCCAFAPGSTVCATGSWSSTVKLWSVPDCRLITPLRGHSERISGLAWHPQATLSQSATALNLVTAGCDSVAKLWPLEGGKPMGELKGHAARLSRIAFHPSGRFVGTTSFDTTWRLWDTERCSELLLQEGHTRALYGIAFHPDGSLVATAGLDALVRLWDLRSGKSIQSFQGHVKQILGLDFSPTGTQLASGSDDHTVRVWDLRKRKCAYTIPAHSSLISHVRFAPGHGRFLLSTSYDNKVKLWSMRDFTLIKTMEGHEGRVMCGDVSDDGKYFVTSAMDHTWKLWAAE